MMNVVANKKETDRIKNYSSLGSSFEFFAVVITLEF